MGKEGKGKEEWKRENTYDHHYVLLRCRRFRSRRTSLISRNGRGWRDLGRGLRMCRMLRWTIGVRSGGVGLLSFGVPSNRSVL